MITFGKKLRECRETKGLSQQEFAKMLKTSHSVIGRYERDEMVPSIEVVKRMADFLDTTVGYLLGETQEVNLFKDPDMLRRFNDINSFPEDDKSHIIYTLDAMINNVKLKTITQHR
ncbi:MAG: helix-turn-helix domain-containing protein [Bacteroidales bacterium]|jgi:transcriptional regulator with XRE-family HTH domain|nr:helix-turn-helix domain-containing protein [Bacteroidales bacterium]HQB28796.1 helix-turn-helix transcriptional regulator [Paludibacter sp.]